MLGRLSIIVAILLPAFFIAGANANAAPAARVTVPRVDTGINDLCDGGPGLCLRDPSNGGTGTPVLTSTLSSSNAEDWKMILDTGRCPNGTVTSSCPGGFISSVYGSQHLPLVVLKNVGQGTLCIRTAAGTQYKAEMGTCDSGQEISSAFVQVQIGSGEYEFVSVGASNAFGTFERLAGGATNNSQAFDDPAAGSGNIDWFALFS